MVQHKIPVPEEILLNYNNISENFKTVFEGKFKGRAISSRQVLIIGKKPSAKLNLIKTETYGI